jgi:hypothetical protein
MPSPNRTKQIAQQAAGGNREINTETLDATKNLGSNDVVHQQYDPDGDRTVVLPKATSCFKGQQFVISNTASAAGEVLTVNQHADDSSTTRGTINPLQQEVFICTGTAWTQEQVSNRPGMTNVIASAVNIAVTAAQSGSIVYLTAADKVVTLPSTAVGLTYTIITGALSSGTGTSVSPAAADKIIGAGGVGVDDKDAINTGATDVIGDSITVVGDGADGWYVVAQHGVWAQQS